VSHYVQLLSAYTDKTRCVEALVATGVPREHIEVHEVAQPLIDYRGNPTHYRYQDANDARFKLGDKAHIIIRRRNVGGAANDVGIYVDPEGKSVVFISEHERRCSKFNDRWSKQVRMQYDALMMEAKAKALGKPFQKIVKGNKIYTAIGV